ncbi:hypothetical protein C2E23DRAFT_326816 [Lenzites betulinus]|nr:hypothetical protein C2E23DRAFT_326816 [Lenzites betulinus]
MAQHAAQAEGLCLRYPESLGPHAQVTQEVAVQMLLRATQLAQHTPFTWSYIDKPTVLGRRDVNLFISEGQLFLIFQMPQLPFPIDGLAYQDREQRYNIPIAGGRELEVFEVKFGFIPGVDTTAFRARRRFRLAKGGHPQLVLIHYSRGQATPIIPSLNQPVRNYPLRPVNEPAVYVMGEKQGQKVFPGPNVPGAGRVPSVVDRAPAPDMGMGYGMPGMSVPGNPQALLAHQNSNMDALEKRALRDRSASMSSRQAAGRPDDDDSADESESISTRTLALARYRRNHELMNEVFMYAAFGSKNAASPPPPYSGFKKDELEEKISKLTSEIDEMKAKATLRQQAASAAANEIVDISMDGASISDTIAT